jgi:hypothetical protein
MGSLVVNRSSFDTFRNTAAIKRAGVGGSLVMQENEFTKFEDDPNGNFFSVSSSFQKAYANGLLCDSTIPAFICVKMLKSASPLIVRRFTLDNVSGALLGVITYLDREVDPRISFIDSIFSLCPIVSYVYVPWSFDRCSFVAVAESSASAIAVNGPLEIGGCSLGTLVTGCPTGA